MKKTKKEMRQEQNVNLNKDEWTKNKLAGNFIQILTPKLEDLPKGPNP